jgi:hypothetical protein
MPAPAYKAPPLPPPPVFSWTGWYIGGNAGYGWGSSANPAITTDPFDSLASQVSSLQRAATCSRV